MDSQNQQVGTKQTYSISKIKKLIDLNNDMTNFKLTFKATSLENLPFEVLIVNQSTLDNQSSDELDYKTVDGYLSGEVVADKNVYQNYFMILKSETPQAVEVEITRERLPDYIETEDDTQVSVEVESDKQTSFINIKYVLIVIAVLIIMYILYSRKSEGNSVLPKSNMKQSLLQKLKQIPLE